MEKKLEGGQPSAGSGPGGKGKGWEKCQKELEAYCNEHYYAECWPKNVDRLYVEICLILFGENANYTLMSNAVSKE